MQSFFTRRVSPRINEGMRTFRSSCIDSVNNNYTFGQYLEGVVLQCGQYL